MHAAEIDSFLRAHQAFGARPLTPAECDRYVEQTTVAARLLGVVARKPVAQEQASR